MAMGMLFLGQVEAQCSCLQTGGSCTLEGMLMCPSIISWVDVTIVMGNSDVMLDAEVQRDSLFSFLTQKPKPKPKKSDFSLNKNKKNKITKQQNNKTTKQQNNKTTKQQKILHSSFFLDCDNPQRCLC